MKKSIVKLTSCFFRNSQQISVTAERVCINLVSQTVSPKTPIKNHSTNKKRVKVPNVQNTKFLLVKVCPSVFFSLQSCYEGNSYKEIPSS